VGHGAAAAILRDGALAAPPMDYEQPHPPAERARYAAGRASFAETGSPALPDGLNLGAQLHWLEALRPDLLTGEAIIVPWPQYWAWRLCGVAASEVTSLGCHSDLWSPVSGGPSSLARQRGWAARLAPLRRAGEALGPVTAEWVERCGLPTDTRIHAGLHDSNAALLASRGFRELAEGDATVLSTGTWFVAMRSPDGPFDLAALPENRDCLVNVDVHGRPIPSARFMGGREAELLVGGQAPIDDPVHQAALVAAAPSVVARGTMVLPSFAPGLGPFPSHRGRWIDQPTDEIHRRAAVAVYLALVADASLDLIGARETLLVEGRFAQCELFVRALATLRPDARVLVAPAEADVSCGALRLLEPGLTAPDPLKEAAPLPLDLAAYRQRWRQETARVDAAA
jgi:sugar (pentulose or hexulose) kinase